MLVSFNFGRPFVPKSASPGDVPAKSKAKARPKVMPKMNPKAKAQAVKFETPPAKRQRVAK